METSNKLIKLKNQILHYLENMDEISPRTDNIFKTNESKICLEASICYFLRKIEGANYHYEKVKEIIDSIRQEILSRHEQFLSNSKNINWDKKNYQIKIEYKIEIPVDNRIYYEIDAFFTAIRSALDFIASVLSKYICGIEFHRFKKAVKHLRNSSDPIALLIQNTWKDWAKDLIDYRDHLIHRGVLPPTSSIYIKVLERTSNTELQKIIDKISLEKSKPIIFPLPIKPNPKIKLTRQEIYKTNLEKNMSNKIGREMAGVPELPLFGTFKDEESIEISLPYGSARKTEVRYKLKPDFIEAEDLCKDYLEKMLDLCSELFRRLEKKFEYLP